MNGEPLKPAPIFLAGCLAICVSVIGGWILAILYWGGAALLVLGVVLFASKAFGLDWTVENLQERGAAVKAGALARYNQWRA